MKVTRTSGLPINPEQVQAFKEELNKGMEALVADMGEFDKLPQDKQGEFMRRFTELKEGTYAKYECEADWDFETILKSKSQLKKLVNQYGVIAFGRGSDGKQLQCFIVDSKF